jgi:phosphoglycerol transferase
MRSLAPRLLWLTQPLLTGLVAWVALGGPDFSFSTPFVFSGEGLYYLAQAKATIDHGWWWTNPSLAAPSTLQAVLLPWGANVDQLVVKLVGGFHQDAATVVIISWFTLVVLSGMTAAWCLRRLGISPFGAWAAGALFALMPYAAYHNITRFTLGLYLVPFAAALAVRLATDEVADWSWRGVRGLLAGVVLLALNTIDYAAFGVVIIAVGSVAGAMFTRRRSRLVAGGLIVAVMAVLMAAAAAPRWAAWAAHGQPAGLHDRPVNAETYGLKIRHLVSPLPDHWLPPLRLWASQQRRASFPLETENAGSRLGLVGSVGLLGLLAVLMAPSRAGEGRIGDLIRGVSRLTLAAILYATIGGFAAVLAVWGVGHPGLLARVAPFIAFLTLAAVALALDRLAWKKRLGVWAAVLTLGLFDQSVAFHSLTGDQRRTGEDIRELREVIDRLEPNHSSRAMIFQLPIRPYPGDHGVEDMGPYDHFRPYLLSRGSRWSYPALSEAQLRWQEAVSQVDPRHLPVYLAREGFTGILVDRSGYGDRGDALIKALETIPNAALLVRGSGRYAAFDLRFALSAR